jgi:hypothetical protein
LEEARVKLSYAIIAAISVASGLSLTCIGLHAQTTGEAVGETAEDAFGSIMLNQAATYFAEFKEACEQRRAAELWGVEVHGPVLLIDPTTRHVVANQADRQGLLEAHDSGVFIGRLPASKPIANAPVEWAGVRWAMIVVQFLNDQRDKRVTLIAHESFHRVQPALGLMVFDRENDHLDTPEGRYWMKLEWNALQSALNSTGEQRDTAVRDALSFRAVRRAQFRQSARRENAMEIREGLAQYTGMRVGGRSAAQVVEHGQAIRDRTDGIVRSFGYISGPLYGYLLDDATNNSWRADVTGRSDLGGMLAEAMNIAPTVDHADELAMSYGGAALRIAEDEREQARQARLAGWRETLVKGPVLIVDLSLCTSRTMDTRHFHPFDTGRTVYGVRTLIAQWGTLEVRAEGGGAILENKASGLGRVSLRNAAADSLSGEGWTLTVADGWLVAPAEREGDLVVRPKE